MTFSPFPDPRATAFLEARQSLVVSGRAVRSAEKAVLIAAIYWPELDDVVTVLLPVAPAAMVPQFEAQLLELLSEGIAKANAKERARRAPRPRPKRSRRR